MSADKTDLIYDALINFREEVRENLKEIKSNAKAHSDEMHAHKVEVSGKFEEMNNRVNTLEEPSKVFAYLKTWAGWTITVCGAIAAGLKLLGKI